MAKSAQKPTSSQTFPTPTTKEQVRVFLGLTGYYRWFILDYARLAVPFTDTGFYITMECHYCTFLKYYIILHVILCVTSRSYCMYSVDHLVYVQRRVLHHLPQRPAKE